jgi:pantothenate kinase-related protein Tda10
VLVVAVLFAPKWLRQKIIRQKAALPYLFRLADVLPTVDQPDADTLQGLIERGAPRNAKPCQIVIGGPIGAGRTSMAAGIGTEFAFKNHKVRYLSLDALLEFAVPARQLRRLQSTMGGYGDTAQRCRHHVAHCEG